MKIVSTLKFNDDLSREIYIFLWPRPVRRATSLLVIISQHDEFSKSSRLLHRKVHFILLKIQILNLSYIVKCIEKECC